MPLRKLLAATIAGLCLLPQMAAHAADSDADDYDEGTVLKEAEEFFGAGAEGLGDIVRKAFKEQGRPNAYIKGEEVAGAVVVGVRYGQGTLQLKDGRTQQVYWQAPSVGLDVGAEATKVFVLIYDLDRPDAIFQRFPGVSGSLYFVAGVGMHYLESDDIKLAPIRFGVGWRQGVNIGYMDFTREKTLNPL